MLRKPTGRMVKRIILNLLSNAVKWHPRGSAQITKMAAIGPPESGALTLSVQAHGDLAHQRG